MTVKERLHQIVEALPDAEAERLLGQLASPMTNGETSVSAKKEELPTDIAAFSAMFDEIIANAPQEELERVPPDLSENLDHYIYGTRKR
jgi:hypothetical protein